MTSVLNKLAMTVGGFMFVLSFGLCLLMDVPVTTALFRSLVALLLGAVIIFLFFKHFMTILYEFVAEQVQEQKKAKMAAMAAAAAKKKAAAQPPPAA